MTVLILTLLLAVSEGQGPPASAAGPVPIAPAAPRVAEIATRLYPPQPLIERTRFGQAINFDVELVNRGTDLLELTAIRAAVRGPSGAIVQRLEINDNGSAPGIHTVPTRTWKPGETHTVYNPFHTLSADIELGSLDYEFVFQNERKETVVARVAARPLPYAARTRLILPLDGRFLVWDGHDFYSHHRRFDFSHPVLKELGIGTNAARYSFDFVAVGADGEFHRAAPQRREDYFGYRAAVVAPADGVVAAMGNEASDEPAEPTRATFAKDPMAAIYGNYIVIDHGNGEFSQLGHLKQGSVRVAVGERVRQGQRIAEVGASGTSLFPHLHYQLTTGAGMDAEGLPATFVNIVRAGTTASGGATAWIDSGDIVATPPTDRGSSQEAAPSGA
jgi:murein DD-endopeptidase MepM/ murein hydrolase activator NlpD